MRLILPFYLVLLIAFSLSAQQLGSFIQTQSEDGVLAIKGNFGATAGYGDQFAVVSNSTDPTVGRVTPTVYLLNEDGTLGTTTNFPQAIGSFLPNASNSPDGTKAWFFGTVLPPENSGQISDLGVIYGGGDDFTYTALDFGVSEFFRGGTATENHLYALTEISAGISNAQNYTLIKLNNDFSLADSLAVPLQEGFFLDYMLADESENYALLVFRSNNGEVRLLGVNLETRQINEIAFPALLEDCNGLPERLFRQTGGLAFQNLNSFGLLTTCGRILSVTTLEATNFSTAIPFNSPSEFGIKLLPLNDGPGDINLLIIDNDNYKKVDLTAGNLTEFESGQYGSTFSLDVDRSAYNANERILQTNGFNQGQFAILTQGEPGNWPLQPVETLPLPELRDPSSRLLNPARLADDLFAVLQVDSLLPTETMQLLNPLTGAVEENIPAFANSGLSAPQLLDNGNYVVQRAVRDDQTFNLDGSLLEFDSNGEVAELATWEYNIGFESAVWQRLIKAPNGDLIAINNAFTPNFASAIDIRRYTQSGTEVYATILSDSISAGFVYATPTVDADGNLYFLVPTQSGLGYRIVSLDPLGAVRYVTNNRTDQRFRSSFSLFRLSFNASGALYVMATILDETNRSQALLAEINPDDGTEVTGTFLAPDLNTIVLWGDFIPGTDSLVLHHGYFSTDGPDATKPYNNRVLFFDENLDLVYAQEVLSTSVNDIFFPEGVTVSQDHIYVVGSRRVPEFDDSFASTLGVNFSNLAVVLGVDDFTETTDLKVYPNPATGLVNLNWVDTRAGEYQLSVLNVRGQGLQQASGSLFSGQNQVTVDLSGYPAGTYYIRLVTPTGVTTQTVSKQ